MIWRKVSGAFFAPSMNETSRPLIAAVVSVWQTEREKYNRSVKLETCRLVPNRRYRAADQYPLLGVKRAHALRTKLFGWTRADVHFWG